MRRGGGSEIGTRLPRFSWVQFVPEGKSKVEFKGKGANLGIGPLPLIPAGGQARVQIRNDQACWEANFSQSVQKNDTRRFMGKSD